MKIDQALLERYHRGTCSQEERAAVERWLLQGEPDDEASLPDDATMNALEESTWASLRNDIEKDLSPRQRMLFGFHPRTWMYTGIAAAITFVVGFSFYYTSYWTAPVLVSNMHDNILQGVNVSGVTIALTPNSRANVSTTVSQMRGDIDFCGAIRIDVPNDIKLTLHAVCGNERQATGQLNCYKGETYIAFNHKVDSRHELVVVNRKDIADLPPALRRQYARLLNI